MTFQLTLQACSPLALSASRASEQFAGGLDHISGSTLRGALAARYLREVSDDARDSVFKPLFLSDQVRYLDLLPTLAADRVSLAYPSTAQACKRFKGSHAESISDSLLSLAAKAHTHSAWQTSDETGIPDALLQEEYCPVCRSLGQRSPLFALSGYYIPLSVQNAAFTIRVVYPIHQRIIAGTSINRVTGTAQQGMLFSRNVLEEGQYFSGRILVADDTPESALEALMSLLATDSIVRVGTGRSRGLGKLQVVKFDPLAGNGSSLAERWQAFNTQARDMGLPDDRVYFSLTLLSHWLRDANPFHPATGLPDGAALGVPAAKLERSVIRHTTILGWNAARRLPKESQQALARGSVLLFSLPPGEADEAQTVLARLEETGLGERQGEGYGQLAVCHPFHYQTIQVQGEVNS